MIIDKWYFKKGKKKTSISRVYLKKGTGLISINNKPLNKQIIIHQHIYQIYQTLNIINYYNFDINILVHGGGIQSQIDSVKTAITKNINIYNPYVHKLLKKKNLLKTDTRIVEPKKLGFKKARKKPQYSKR